MEATQQMNVRIPADLKREGDAEFARLGFTPSQMVRCLYQYVIKHGHDREKMAELLETSEEDEERARERERKLQMVEGFWREHDRLRTSIGLSNKTEGDARFVEWVNQDSKALASQACLGRFQERTA